MKRFFTGYALFVFLLGLPSAQAGITHIHPKPYCTYASLSSVYVLFADYAQYSVREGHRYGIPLLPDTSLLNMSKSNVSWLSQAPDLDLSHQPQPAASRAVVLFNLQPKDLAERYYAKFLTICSVTPDGAGFTQKCNLSTGRIYLDDGSYYDPTLKTYALKGFDSTIEVERSGSACATGQIQISVDVTIETNPNDMREIKDALKTSLGPLGGLVDKIFDENSFFNDYYSHVYETWMKDLR